MKVLLLIVVSLMVAATTGQRQQGRRRLDAATINAAIEVSLPAINDVLQEKIEDPIEINKDLEKAVELVDGPCSGELAAIA